MSEATRRRQAPRLLRPTAKLLPEDTRRHNRSLVLQTLYRDGGLSRADIARATALTRVTTSDLVADLISEGLVVELGQRDDARPGKPATLLDVDRGAYSIVGLDLSEQDRFRGAVLDLDGRIVHRAELARGTRTGEKAVRRAVELAISLVAQAAATAPVLGVGIGSPGIVDDNGVVLRAPNLAWAGLPLQERMSDELGLPVIATNDANAAVLAEHSFGGAGGDVILVRVGLGVGAGLLLGGQLLHGSRSGAGEIGHVVVGTDGGPVCVCGTRGCLEAWLGTPRLAAALEAAGEGSRDEVLAAAGRRLGIALAPVVVALDLPEVVLAGPPDLLDGALSEATAEALAQRSQPDITGGTAVRTTTLGRDIVLRGAAAVVLSSQLGVS